MIQKISFKPLVKSDLELLRRWRAESHVAEWYGLPLTLDQIEAKYASRLAGTEPTKVFIVEIDSRPIGMIQCTWLDDEPEEKALIGLNRAVGIDYFIGEPEFIGQGLGTEIIGRFVDSVRDVYPDAETVIADPSERNIASIKALKKAGFTEYKTIKRPEESDRFVIMMRVKK